MQYMGSKRQIARTLAVFLEQLRHGRPFVEPFCGTLSVTALMAGDRHASDGSRCLITLLRAVQNGWVPPSSLAEEEYARLSTTRDPDDPMTAFAGFGCSFGGKFFGGFARRDSNHWGREVSAGGQTRWKWAYNKLDIERWVARAPSGAMRTRLAPAEVMSLSLAPPEKVRNYFARAARDALISVMATCRDVPISCGDYREREWKDAMIYADPPYRGVTGYASNFDSDTMWQWARDASRTNLVVVSEHEAPIDFVCVRTFGAEGKLKGNGSRAGRVERLFVHESRIGRVE